jgi:hypothetical protein
MFGWGHGVAWKDARAVDLLGELASLSQRMQPPSTARRVRRRYSLVSSRLDRLSRGFHLVAGRGSIVD